MITQNWRVAEVAQLERVEDGNLICKLCHQTILNPFFDHLPKCPIMILRRAETQEYYASNGVPVPDVFLPFNETYTNEF